MKSQAAQRARDGQKAKSKVCCDKQDKNKRIQFSKETRQDVYLKSDRRCAICGKPLQIDFSKEENYATIDHIMPLSKGGKNEMENYQATCERCNRIKSNIMPEVFANDFASVLAQEIIENSYQRKIFLAKILRMMCKQSLLAVKATLL